MGLVQQDAALTVFIQGQDLTVKHQKLSLTLFCVCHVQLFAQVQIIEEQTPLHIPRDSFGLLASVPVFESGKVPRVAATSPLPYELSDDETAECEVSASDSGTEEDRVLHR